jgi:hypothetical protein
MFVKIASLVTVLVLIFGVGIVSVQAAPPEPHQAQTNFQNAGSETELTPFQFQTKTQRHYAQFYQLLYQHMFKWGTLETFVPGNPWIVEGSLFPATSPSLRGYGFGWIEVPIEDVLPQ